MKEKINHMKNILFLFLLAAVAMLLPGHLVASVEHDTKIPQLAFAAQDRLVTSENLAGKALLFGHKTQQPVEGHFLDRLRGGSVELATDVKPLGVGVGAELDCGAEFGRDGFCFGIHRVSGWRISPPPDNPMPSSSKCFSARDIGEGERSA